jgi:hypothetical protein
MRKKFLRTTQHALKRQNGEYLKFKIRNFLVQSSTLIWFIGVKNERSKFSRLGTINFGVYSYLKLEKVIIIETIE